MPGIFIVLTIALIVMIIGICLSDKNEGWIVLAVLGGTIALFALIISLPAQYRVVTRPALHASFAKTPTSVTIEATVEGELKRKTYTDIGIYLLLDKGDARIVWHQAFNAWGAEVDSGTGFAVETGPVDPTTY